MRDKTARQVPFVAQLLVVVVGRLAGGRAAWSDSFDTTNTVEKKHDARETKGLAARTPLSLLSLDFFELLLDVKKGRLSIRSHRRKLD